MVLLLCGNQEYPLGGHTVLSNYSEHLPEQIFSFMAVNVFTEKKRKEKAKR